MIRKSQPYHAKDASHFPLSLMERQQLEDLCASARRLDTRLAIPATSSNFSHRFTQKSGVPHPGFFITRSGLHKRLITPSDFLRVDGQGKAQHSVSPKPSDETLLHATLYKNLPEAKAILHCHAPEMEFARYPSLRFEGHELCKALGKRDHLEPVVIPVYKNTQDMETLARHIEQDLFEKPSDPSTAVHTKWAFILERHGIYCAGRTVAEAEMRLEAILHLLRAQFGVLGA